MKLIVGLGNPGKEYEGTRHNTGYLAIDELRKSKLPSDVIVKKSDVFMNESGEFVEQLLSKYPNTPISSVYVVHDDLDIPLGYYKIQFGRGPKDHNGLASVDAKLETTGYWHIRVGIDNRSIDNRPMGEEYVLQNFAESERVILDRTIKEVCKRLVILLKNTS